MPNPQGFATEPYLFPNGNSPAFDALPTSQLKVNF
jgi:hypothetical protein